MESLRLCVVGDLHLGFEGASVIELPDLETAGVDAVISVGDIIDDNRDHAATVETGDRYEAVGREWFEAIANEYTVPIVAVPGNHDPVECTERLVEGVDGVLCAHDTVVDESVFPSLDVSFGPFEFVTDGCKRFDLREGFEYRRFPELNPTETATSGDIDYRATEIARQVEATFGRMVTHDLTIEEGAKALGIDDRNRDAFAECAETVTRRFEALTERFAACSGVPVLLSHESPFFVDFDYHHQWDGLRGRLHRGSLPLKLAIRSNSPFVTFCGHLHNSGRDVVKTVDGYSQVINLGYRGIAIVTLDAEAGVINVERVGEGSR
ncbi:metallophosphoesterase family protein [Natronoglomus mannanivorans]|uniref:Metallophosphoesterase n=1 Tax=Natronoglomus mannanivorans TaxID=2979990 RepID=A0AAP2Z4E7_9EURY|nr:metallophosphoesterase [Halobacteria archaeon AArc-xg1-1]